MKVKDALTDFHDGVVAVLRQAPIRPKGVRAVQQLLLYDPTFGCSKNPFVHNKELIKQILDEMREAGLVTKSAVGYRWVALPIVDAELPNGLRGMPRLIQTLFKYVPANQCVTLKTLMSMYPHAHKLPPSWCEIALEAEVIAGRLLVSRMQDGTSYYQRPQG